MGFLQEVAKDYRSDAQKESDHTVSSATENPKQQNIIDNLVKQYEKVRVSQGKANTDNIYQEVIKPKDDTENQMLVDLLRKKEFKSFDFLRNQKTGLKTCVAFLRNSNWRVDEIHGDKSQQYRSKAIQKFKSRNIQVMVATDVASRGIDIDNITHVINTGFLVPESYIHRI